MDMSIIEFYTCEKAICEQNSVKEAYPKDALEFRWKSSYHQNTI